MKLAEVKAAIDALVVSGHGTRSSSASVSS